MRLGGGDAGHLVERHVVVVDLDLQMLDQSRAGSPGADEGELACRASTLLAIRFWVSRRRSSLTAAAGR